MVALDVGRYATESLALERLLSHASDEHKDRNSREDTIAELARKERFDRGLVHLLFRAFVRWSLLRAWCIRSILSPVHLCFHARVYLHVFDRSHVPKDSGIELEDLYIFAHFRRCS
jgi:Arc/MetJ family transcription regulator